MAIALFPVVLAGGTAADLWPLSRDGYPKELLRVNGERSLLQETVRRVCALDGLVVEGASAGTVTGTSDLGARSVEVMAPVVVCNEAHRFLMAEQLRQIDVDGAEIVLESEGRGTAPAVTVAAERVLSRLALATNGDRADDALIMVMPADHALVCDAGWESAVKNAVALGCDNKIVAFGVVPDRAETNYGYIRTGACVGGAGGGHAIEAFVEKPSSDAAEGFLSAGKYLWNTGMYTVRPTAWQALITLAQPDMASACREAVDSGHEDGIFFRLDKSAFERQRSDSIDYALMEPLTDQDGTLDWHTRSGGPITPAVVALTSQWSDIGTWASMLDIDACGKDPVSGNVVRGDVVEVDSKDSVLISNRRLMAAAGLRNIVAIETPDAILIADRTRSEGLSELMAELREEGRDEIESHTRVYRPWGDYESLDVGERYQVKRLTVKPGEVLSLQMHHHRAEHWVVVTGTARVTCGDEVFLLTENESTYIPIGTKHRLENPGNVPLEIIEVQSGSYLGEDDIVRFEDRYNRAPAADA